MTNNKNLLELIKTLDGFFAKAPVLPVRAKEVLVKIFPILAIVFGVLGLIGGVLALGFLPVAVVGGADNSALHLVGAVLSIVASALLIMAYPKLNVKSFEGWKLLFLSELVSVVSAVVSLQLVSAVVSFLIGFYILYQIKSYYK